MGLLVQEVEFYLFVYLWFNKTEENQVNLAMTARNVEGWVVEPDINKRHKQNTWNRWVLWPLHFIDSIFPELQKKGKSYAVSSGEDPG